MRPSDRGIKRWTHRRSGLPGARQLLLRAREKGQQASEADTLHLGAAIAARIDPFEAGAVQEQYHAAMALAEELRMRPLIAHCHLGLGKLYRRMGKLEQAQQHLTPATTMYGEMGMTYIVVAGVRCCCNDDVRRDGDDVLVGEGGDRTESWVIECALLWMIYRRSSTTIAPTAL